MNKKAEARPSEEGSGLQCRRLGLSPGRSAASSEVQVDEPEEPEQDEREGQGGPELESALVVGHGPSPGVLVGKLETGGGNPDEGEEEPFGQA